MRERIDYAGSSNPGRNKRGVREMMIIRVRRIVGATITIIVEVIAGESTETRALSDNWRFRV